MIFTFRNELKKTQSYSSLIIKQQYCIFKRSIKDTSELMHHANANTCASRVPSNQ
jgi:hypothetical protein